MEHETIKNIRWKFTKEISEEEKNTQRLLSQKIDDWWENFTKNKKTLNDCFNKQINFDIVSFMQKNLQAINQNLMWEFGSALKTQGHRLVITPEIRKDLRPLVDEIIRRAPVSEGWEFYSYRLPVDFTSAKSMVEARTGSPIIPLNFRAEKNTFNQMEITLSSVDAHSEEEINNAYQQGFLFFEAMLGEEVLDKWIGSFEIDTKTPTGNNQIPISELGNWWEKTKKLLQNSLSEKPFFERIHEANGTIFKIEPPEKEEYSAQEDIFVGKSLYKEIWQNAHNGSNFTSERFSKLQEIFCYIKIDGREKLSEEHFKDKGEIEDAIDDALINAKAGCIIGGGSGLHYSYIDLALLDLEKGIELIRQILQKGNITKKAWILFFDSELASEWIGIWKDSPLPPMQDFETQN